MNQNRKPSILIGYVEIAGCSVSLKKGFRDLGYKCEFINLADDKFAYSDDVVGVLPKYGNIIKYIINKRLHYKNNLIKKITKVVELALKVPLLVISLLSFNTFVFVFNSTLFNYRELPILKFFGKKIIYLFLGSDSRPPYIDGAFLNLLTIDDIKDEILDKCFQSTLDKKKTINLIEKYTDIIINHPSHAYFNEKNYYQSIIIGYSFSEKEVLAEDEPNIIRNTRILHAPSNTNAKGTQNIRLIVDRLINKGFNIEFTEIHGVKNDEIIKSITKCDFVIDQIYSDSPISMISIEAASQKKASVIAGYSLHELSKIVPFKYYPPTCSCNTENVEDEIVKLINDRDYREKIGNQMFDYIRNERTPKKVAEKYLQLISTNTEDDWMLNPYDLDYIYPGFIEMSLWKEFMRKYIKKFGSDGLFLNDKPHLIRKIYELIS